MKTQPGGPSGSFDHPEKDKLIKAADNIISAWQSLPGDRDYTPREIGDWLVYKMEPAISKYRKLRKLRK